MGEETAEVRPGKEFIGLKEFFSLSVKIVGTLAGFAALFILFGYTIILSFINSVKMYGLTNFPQEFYKEATMKFVGDMFETYGRHPYCSAAMIAVISVAVYAVVRHHRRLSSAIDNNVIGFVSGVSILLVTLFTLRLEVMSDRILYITEVKKVFIFMVAVPVMASSFVYLALKFKAFMEKPYRFYYIIALFFLGLFISIPVGYGDNIFDMDVFPVVGFDYADSAGVPSLEGLRNDIKSQGNSNLFFLMGHTLDREIFFDNQSLTPPAKMILVERNLIKYLHISRNNIISLRAILREPEEVEPVPAQGQKAVGDLPEDIKDLIGKEKR